MEAIRTTTGPKGAYKVGKKLGGTERFNMYECVLPDGRVGILKIALTVEQNGLLDREAYILQTMKDEAKPEKDEYYLKHEGEDLPKHQFYFFPDLVESFIDEDQDNRRINILDFGEFVDNLGDLVPLSHLVSREHVRVDPRTSAWIMGRLLKFLAYTHRQGILVGNLTGENILINREKHYVAVFDWTMSTINSSDISEEETGLEISRVSDQVIYALGGGPAMGTFPESDQLVDDRYTNFLLSLSWAEEKNAMEAHGKFYQLIRTLWPTEYYPFTTINN
ncbi:MAG: hypothetical protein WAV23_00710 [Minisyncoccia bacterium]